MSLRMTKAVWKCSKAKGPAKLVLLCLAEHADDDGIAWPSQARLARLCGVDERNIRRALLRLLGLNLIVAVGRGKQGVIVYRIKPDADDQQGAKSSALSPDKSSPLPN